MRVDPIGLAGGLNLFQYADSVGKPSRLEINLYTYSLNDPINRIDPLGLYSIDEFVQDAANYSAGFGDTLASGFGLSYLFWLPSLTETFRQQYGIDSFVNECSGAYSTGEWSGYVWGAIAGGAGTGRALQIEINAFSNGNIFKLISKRLKAGFRIDPAHHGKKWGHRHFWRW